MLALALAVSLAASPLCPPGDPKAELLSLHETARQAHLRGDASLIAPTMADQILFADKGVLRTQTRAEVAKFFAGYFQQVRYREWRDVSPPVVTASPDGQMAWMAVAIEARYARADKPAEGEKSFKSSWIATYQRDGCAWRMTGIASDVVETK
jgi:hypothetical protein